MKLIEKLFGSKAKKVEKTSVFLKRNIPYIPDSAAKATAEKMVSHAKGKKWKNLLIGLGIGIICVVLDALLARICLPCGGIFIKSLPDLIAAFAS